MLEAGEPFSPRALARRAGVSPTAPYRHFPDRDALESALAVQGLRELMSELAAGGAPSTSGEAAELGVRYVRFALAGPALFRLMFGRPCDDRDEDRVRASGALHDYLADAMGTLYPGADAAALATAGWALAHGLAFLHLDGKLDNTDPGRRRRPGAGQPGRAPPTDSGDPRPRPDPGPGGRTQKVEPA